MKTSRTWLFVVLAGLAANAALAEPYVEQAQADITPWSGYWWPLSDGGLVRPLRKYDAATGQAAVAWEQANRQMGSGVPGWFGFCHAWAASSIMESEPRQARTSRAADRAAVPLTVGDQKGCWPPATPRTSPTATANALKKATARRIARIWRPTPCGASSSSISASSRCRWSWTWTPGRRSGTSRPTPTSSAATARAMARARPC